MLKIKLIFLFIFLFAIPAKAEMMSLKSGVEGIVFDSEVSRTQMWNLIKDKFAVAWQKQIIKKKFEVDLSTSPAPSITGYGARFFLRFPDVNEYNDLHTKIENVWNNWVSQGKIIKGKIYVHFCRNAEYWKIRKECTNILWLEH